MMKIGVYGLGRFGSFWAQVLSSSFEVIGYNRNPERKGPPGITRVYSLAELAQADVIFLCTAISAMEATARTLKPFLREDTLIVDTCSVKVEPLKVLSQVLKGQPLLGTHPMFGPDSAKEGVAGLPLVITPVVGQEGLADFWIKTFQDMAMIVHVMSPDEHDQQAAYTQGITHFIGRVLDELDIKPNPIGTSGYNSLLNIRQQTCNDPWQLFVDLQQGNPHTTEMREDLQKAVGKIMKELSNS